MLGVHWLPTRAASWGSLRFGSGIQLSLRVFLGVLMARGFDCPRAFGSATCESLGIPVQREVARPSSWISRTICATTRSSSESRGFAISKAILSGACPAATSHTLCFNLTNNGRRFSSEKSSTVARDDVRNESLRRQFPNVLLGAIRANAHAATGQDILWLQHCAPRFMAHSDVAPSHVTHETSTVCYTTSRLNK
jgi:hypothetical protein